MTDRNEEIRKGVSAPGAGPSGSRAVTVGGATFYVRPEVREAREEMARDLARMRGEKARQA